MAKKIDYFVKNAPQNRNLRLRNFDRPLMVSIVNTLSTNYEILGKKESDLLFKWYPTISDIIQSALGTVSVPGW